MSGRMLHILIKASRSVNADVLLVIPSAATVVGVKVVDSSSTTTGSVKAECAANMFTLHPQGASLPYTNISSSSL